MFRSATADKPETGSGTPLPVHRGPLVLVYALGMSLGSFFAGTFALCVLFDLLFPTLAMNPVWAPLLPGFAWLSWPSFFLGLVETFAYGWYVALVFGPLYNLFAGRVELRLSTRPRL